MIVRRPIFCVPNYGAECGRVARRTYFEVLSWNRLRCDGRLARTRACGLHTK